MTTLGDIIEALSGSGLALRGGFVPTADDGAPEATRALFLIGHAGRDGLWVTFEAGRQDEPDPLDAWTRRTLDPIAENLGATALYPFSQPYLPFQTWAQKAEPVFPSPLGVLIDIRSGLWHGYRGALAFSDDVVVLPREEAPNPCAVCVDKPCVKVCPVAAVSPDSYDTDACRDHVRGAGGDCRDHGCLARRACPVGAGSAYDDEQMRFHMAAFLASAP